MIALQASLGPPIHIVVRVQACIRAFLARKRAREQAAREALRRSIVVPVEDIFAPSVDDTIGQRDLCRSRTSTLNRASTIGRDRWGSKSMAERRRSMAVGIASGRKSLKRTGSASARPSLMGGQTNPFEFEEAEEFSLPSTRASTRSTMSPPQNYRTSKSCRSSISPGHMSSASFQTTPTPTSKSCRSSLMQSSPIDTETILELAKSDTDESPPPPRPDTVPLAGANPDSRAPSPGVWDAASPPPAPRTSVQELADLPTFVRPHSSCASVRQRPGSVYRLGSICVRQIAIPTAPVRASSALRRIAEPRAIAPRLRAA